MWCRSLSTRSASRDPCFVQGERITTPQSIEINPNYVHKKDSDCNSSTDSDSDEDPTSVRLQPTPTSQLLIKRRQRRRRLYIDQYTSESEMTEDSIEMEEVEEAEYVPKRQRRQQRISSIQSVSSIGAEDKCQSVSEELKETDRTATKPTEQRRHVSTLFSPNSLLLNENLKVLVHTYPYTKVKLIWVEPSFSIITWPYFKTNFKFFCTIVLIFKCRFRQHFYNNSPIKS